VNLCDSISSVNCNKPSILYPLSQSHPSSSSKEQPVPDLHTLFPIIPPLFKSLYFVAIATGLVGLLLTCHGVLLGIFISLLCLHLLLLLLVEYNVL
jgi:hypothetical protein